MELREDIIGYEGLYQVSTLGIVKSLNYNHTGKEGILKQNISNKGYYYIGLHNKGICRKYLIHRLIAIAFISNPKNKPEVNHIDGNRLNNNINNLEWATQSENEIHKWRVLKRNNSFQTNHPTKGKFGIHSKKAICVLQYTLDGIFIKERGSIIDASKELHIPRGNISTCCNGKRNKVGGFNWKYKSLLINNPEGQITSTEIVSSTEETN